MVEWIGTMLVSCQQLLTNPHPALSLPFLSESHVTMETTLLIKQLIRLDVKTRLTAVGALEAIQNRLSRL